MGDGVLLQLLDSATAAAPGGRPPALTLRLVYGDFSLLLPGSLVAEDPLPAAVVLQATSSQHGQPSFLQTIQPQIVVTTAAAVEEAEQSKAVWTSTVHEAGAAVVLMDEFGMIELKSDGRRMWWEGTKE
jgi:hypothetical protein